MGAGKLKLERAVIVEGRDDVDAVRKACDALIIATHGFGITEETWAVMDKAYREKGLIILTDPDHAGEEIRRKLGERFPDAIHAYLARGDAESSGDIGVENASPEDIAEALSKAIAREDGKAADAGDAEDGKIYADMRDMRELGLAGAGGAKEKRAAVCKLLGIGYANASAMVNELRGFGIDIDELTQAVKKVQ